MNSYVFITGASSGFGKATALVFAKNGYSLIITGRREDRLIALSEEIKNLGVDCIALTFDVRNEQDVNKQIDTLSNEIRSKICILINNAGLAVGRGPIDTGLTDDWDRIIDTNVKGLLYVSRKILPLMKANKSGHVFNIGSIAGKEVYAGGNVYCASKHAVDALSKAMRIDLVDFNIKVTNIAPGAAETEFSLVRFKGDEATAKSVYQGYDPLVAQDIAETIYFVATRPQHVTINDLTIMPTAQASATVFRKV